MTRKLPALLVATLCCLFTPSILQAQEKQHPSAPPAVFSKLQQMEAEFDVRMHELGVKMSERGLAQALVEVEKIQQHVVRLERDGSAHEVRQAQLELKQATIHAEMREIELEISRLNLERIKARQQHTQAAKKKSPEKAVPVRVEYSDGGDVIIRGPAASVDKIKALIQKATQQTKSPGAVK